MEDATFKLDILLGSVEAQSRMRQVGNALIGEGRRIERDRFGVVTLTTPWEPSGIELRFAPEPAPQPWWKLW